MTRKWKSIPCRNCRHRSSDGICWRCRGARSPQHKRGLRQGHHQLPNEIIASVRQPVEPPSSALSQDAEV